MKIILKTVENTDEKQLMNRDTAKYIHKNWIVIAAYYVAASFAVALGIAVAVFVFAVLGASKSGRHNPMPVKDALIYSMVSQFIVGRKFPPHRVALERVWFHVLRMRSSTR